MRRLTVLGLLTSAAIGCGGASQMPAQPAPAQPPPPQQEASAPSPAASPQGAWTGSADQLALRFVESLRGGRFDEATSRFTTKMAEKLPAAELRTAFQELEGSLGAWKGTQEPEARHDDEGYDIVRVPCAYERGTLTVRVVLNRERRVAGLWFDRSYEWQPPTYADASRFEEQEVTVGSGAWATPGTLAMPAGSGPFPAVVLVHGSGPSDRDETTGPHKLFKDLAWGLASRGIAVLRYDKRTRTHRGQLKGPAGEQFTQKQEYVEDAVAAVSLLGATQRIDRNRIFVVGHSEGASLAPRIAEASAGVRGIALLAAPARPFQEIVLDQLTYLAGLDGTVDDNEAARIDEMRKAFATLQAPSFSMSTPASELPYGIPPAYWIDAQGYDAIATTKRLQRPVFVAQGERDYQVTMADFEGWRAALQGRKNAVLRSYPRLHHHFMEGTGEGKSSPQEYDLPDHADETLVTDLASWVTTVAR